MFNKRTYLFFFLVIIYGLHLSGQTCNYTIKGVVFDEGTTTPLEFVNVLVQETSTGDVSDGSGQFEIPNNCPGHLHIVFSHIGCEPVTVHLDLESDTTLTVQLSHSNNTLDAFIISEKANKTNIQPKVSISRKSIEDNPNKNLAALLENETGVYLLKNGSSISKPIVHGLYGNRLPILNNGILQSGQQWGNDHSPEIDPNIADKIILLKGVNAIEYAGGNLGSIVLVEPKKISRDPHLHGQVNYAYETNGRGQTVNTRLGKYTDEIAWRLGGSYKKFGDKHTPDYFLNNTGLIETNLFLQIEKSWMNKLFVDLYASTFNTELGVLRGSHIGNLTDLEQALSRDVPFFTEEAFSFNIDPPKQDVSHHLAKLKANYSIQENQNIELVLAVQINDRKEFDIRRSGRSETPALSLQQVSYNAELKYNHAFENEYNFKLGTQQIFIDNDNMPGTGILPLIPNYIAWKNGAYATLNKDWDSGQWNIGLRYDGDFQEVVTLDDQKDVVRYENFFHNVSAIVGTTVNVTSTSTIGFNSGYAVRNPAINELYGNGLHQGVSGIEEGDINLNSESAFKNVIEYNWLPNSNFSFNALVYNQVIDDYIFLNPQEEVRLTIRGAFPVFKYEQTDANIYGLDLSSQFTINNWMQGHVKYSFLKGHDRSNDIPLVFMPPNRIFGSLTFRTRQSIKLSEKMRLENPEIELNAKHIFRQNHLLDSQDFVPAPDAYSLLGFRLSFNVSITGVKLKTFVNGENLLNTRYRDYLNRQRYFSDDLGRSLTFGLGVKF